MAIIKIIKRDCPYVTIDKTGVDDPNLSWAATGLLTYLIGRPGNWKINITHLSSVKTCKETATKSALKELREANYCHYFIVRKNGKISETFYLVFEVPTNYEEVLENYIDLKDGETILYQPVKIGKNTENKTKRKLPQVENQLVKKKTGNKEVLPQVENPLVENLLVENQGLLIKDTTNNRITNNKTTTSEDKKSSSSLKENSLEKETINEFLRKYNLSKITRKNILNLYLKKLITKERIIEIFQVSKEKEWGEGAIFKALKENWNIQFKNTTKDITVLSEDEARKKIRNRVNYYINVFETNNNFEEAKNNFIEELKQINGFEDLKSEYLGKFEDYVNNKKNIKKTETNNKFDISREKFLNLSEVLQDNITKKAERLYNGQPEILNQLKRKSSKNFYLKFIWVEILKTIDKEYPEIDIVGMKGEVR